MSVTKARMSSLLYYAKKRKWVKKRKETDCLWENGINDGVEFLDRIRGKRTVREAAQHEAGKLDMKIWEDDPWCLAFTYFILLEAGESTDGIDIQWHGRTPLGIHERGFMEQLLQIPYIRERETYDGTEASPDYI